MRIYLNTSAYNRPFDNLSAERVRVEAEAVASLLAAAAEATRIVFPPAALVELFSKEER